MNISQIDRFVNALDGVEKGQYLHSHKGELGTTRDKSKDISEKEITNLARECLTGITGITNANDRNKLLGKFVHALEHYSSVKHVSFKAILKDAQKEQKQAPEQQDIAKEKTPKKKELFREIDSGMSFSSDMLELLESYGTESEQEQKQIAQKPSEKLPAQQPLKVMPQAPPLQKLPTEADIPEEVLFWVDFMPNCIENPKKLEEAIKTLLPDQIAPMCKSANEVLVAWQLLALKMGMSAKELSICNTTEDISAWMKEESASHLIAVCSKLPGGPEFLEKHSSLPRFEQAKLIDEWIRNDKTAQQVTQLNLTKLNLRHLPDAICSLKGLQKLDLAHNHLVMVSKNIRELNDLKTLILDYNDLKELPDMQPFAARYSSKIEPTLQALETISASHNQLTALPNDIVKLASLRTLILDHNQLKALPPKMDQLRALEQLQLGHNQLMTLPAELGQLPAIKTLEANNNPLLPLPAEVRKMRALKLSTAPPRKTGIPEADRAVPPWERALDTLRYNIRKVVGKEPDEAIMAQSLMRKERIEIPKLTERLDTKMLAHIHGDVFVGRTGYEGEPSSATLGFLGDFFESPLGKKYAQMPFVGMVKTAYDANEIIDAEAPFDAKMKAYKEFLNKQLDSSTDFILSGGWVHEPYSHEVYYEIKKQKNGQYSFSIFNTSDGLKYHPKVIVQGHQKYFPFVEYGNIPRENLTSDIFVKALLELQLLPNRALSVADRERQLKLDAVYNSRDIYEGLVGCLGGTPSPFTADLNDYISHQHAGTCAWSCLMSVARSHLPKGESEPNFMRFRYEIGLHSLVMFCDKYVDATDSDEVRRLEKLANDTDARMLLQKSVEKFASDTLEAYELGMIDEKEFAAAYATCRDILQEVDKANKLFLQQNALDITVQLEIPESRPIPNRFGTTMDLRVLALDSSTALKSDYVEVPWNFSHIKFRPEELHLQLEASYKHFCEVFKAKQPTVAIMDGLQEFLAALPMPERTKDNFWNQIPEDKRHACMEQLCKLSELLVRAAATQEYRAYPSPEDLLAVTKCMVIQHHLTYLDVLSNKVSKDILSFGMGLGEIESFFDHGAGDNNFYDPKHKAQFARLMDYLHEYGASRLKDAHSVDIGIPTRSTYIEKETPPKDLPIGLKVIKEYLDKEKLRDLQKRFPNLKVTSEGVEHLGLIMAQAYALEDAEGRFSPKAFSCLTRQALACDLIFRGNWSSLRWNGPDFTDLRTPLFQVKAEEVNDYRGLGKDFTVNIGGKTSIFSATSYAHDISKNPGSLGYSALGLFLKEGYFKHGQRNIYDDMLPRFGYSRKSEIHQYFKKEEYGELLDFLSGESYHELTQVPNILSMMIKNRDQLEKIPYQSFFRKILCEGNFIESSLGTSPLMAKKLHDYVMETLVKGKEENKIKTAAYMLQLAMLISPRLRQFGYPINLDVRKELIELLKLPYLNNEEKATLYRVLIANYYPCSEPLGENDVRMLLEANMFLCAHKNSFPAEFHDDFLDRRREVVISRSMDQIRKALSGPAKDMILNNAINNVWGAGTVALDTAWNCERGFPLCVSANGVTSFDVREGTFFTNNMPTCTLPRRFVEDHTYKKVFKGKEFVVNAVNLKTFAFNDDNGIPTKISMQGSAVVIYKQLKKGDPTWYALVDESFPNEFQLEVMKAWGQGDTESVKMFGATSLYHDYTHWLPVDANSYSPADLLLVDSTGRLSHQVQLEAGRNRQVRSVERLPDGEFPTMQLVDIYKQGESEARQFDFLKGIEQIHDILVWKRPGENDPALIEMPSLGLKFVLEKDETGELRAKCLNVPGFYIAKEQRLRSMGDFKNFLLLESKDKKRRQVIIPRRKIDTKAMKQGSLFTKITLEQKPSSQPFAVEPFLRYDVTKSASIASTRPEQNLYLAYLWLGQKQYEKGMACLREFGQTVRAYTKQERQLLFWIQELYGQTLDQDPKASAAYLCATACLLSNRERFGDQHLTPEEQEHEKGYLEGILLEYKNYLDIREHATTLQLTRSEELYILNQLKKGREISNDMHRRLKYLETGESESREMSLFMPEATEPRFNINAEDLNFAIKESNEKAKGQYPRSVVEERLLRPGKAGFSQCFLAHYAKAKDHHPDILNILRLARSDPQVPEGLTHLLEFVYHHPDRFPAAESLKGLEAKPREEIVAQMVKTYEGLLKEKAAPKKTEPAEGGIFRLPKARKVEAEIKIAAADRVKPVKVHAVPTPILGATLLKQIFKEPERLRITGGESKDLQADLVSNDKDPVIQQTFAKARKEASIAADFTPPIAHALKAGQTSKLQTLLKVQQAELTKLALVAESQVLELANKQLEGLAGIHGGVRQQATILKNITINDLLVLSANKNTQGIRELNPSLSERDVQVIYQNLTEYLLLQTRVQQISRGSSLVDSIIELGDRNEASKAELTNQLYQELTAVRMYDPVERPEYLLYEYCSDLMLRSEQVANLRRMLYPTVEENPNVILQMLMGAGKTKVLAPILALKNADGEHLSLIVVAESQFGTVPEEIYLQSKGVFKQTTEPLQFDRNTVFTLAKLQKIHQRLKDTIRNRDYLIMTNKSLACLALKYQEAAYNYSVTPSEELGKKVEEMRQILLLFKDKSKAIIDEADLVLDSMHDVIFAMGDPGSLKSEHRELSSEIFQYLLTSAEFTKQFPEGITGITPETYHKEVKDHLINSFVDRLITEGKPPLGTHLKGLSKEDLYNLKSYYLAGRSMGDEEQDRALQKMVDSIADRTTQNLLALMKEQFTHLLPLTLSKQCDTHYGFSHLPNKILAVPYIANNTPNEASQFGNPYELLNYTLLTYNKKGVPFRIIQEHMDRLGAKIIAIRAKDSRIKLNDIPEYREFREICGVNTSINPFKFSPSEVQTVVDTLNKDKSLLMGYVKTHVLPAITIYPMQLSMNSQGFVDMFHQTQGFTGTPWNKDTLHQRLEAIEAEGTDGITLNLLKRQCENEVHELPPPKFDTKPTPAMITQSLVDRVVDTQKDLEHFKAIIDTGSMFNGIDNESVARALLNKLKDPIKGICFYKGDKRVILERGKSQPIPFNESLLTEEERFTYYDQRHCTGEDIRQAPLACAAVTIGKDLKFRDLAQGSWRMRGLLNKGQRISLVFSDDAGNVIRQNVGLPRRKLKTERELKEAEMKGAKESAIQLKHILQHVYINQGRQLGRHCITAAKHKVHQVMENEATQMLLRTPLAGLTTAVNAVKNVFISPVADIPFLAFGRREELDNADKVMGDRETLELQRLSADAAKVNPVFAEATMRARMKAVTRLDLLPKKIPAILRDEESTEIELEMEVQKEMQREVETHVQEKVTARDSIPIWTWHWKVSDFKREMADIYDPGFYRVTTMQEFVERNSKDSVLPLKKDKDLPKCTPPIFSLRDLVASSDKMRMAQDFFDDDILASYNYIPMQKAAPSEVAETFMNAYQIPTTHRLVIKTKDGRPKTILISQEEALFFYKELAKTPRGDLEFYLYDINAGIIQSSSNGDPDKLMQDPDFQRQMLKLDLLDCDFELPQQKEAIFARCMPATKEAAQHTKQFFEQIVLRRYPSKVESYRKSPFKAALDTKAEA